MGEPSLPKIQDADLKDKVVLLRVDHNVVKKGVINDPYRIDVTIGTLYHIVAKGGKLILMTHVGRPRDKKTGAIEISNNTSVMPIVEYLQNKLHIHLKVPEFRREHTLGYMGIETSINHMIRELKQGGIDGIYLPNTRWFQGEEAGGDEEDRFAYQLAGLADVFVNDAFGSWQAHASTVGVLKHLPSYAGFVLQAEIRNLKRIMKPKRPLVAVVAGAKFDTKIRPLYALLEKADYLVLGGVIYNAYLCARYGIKIKGVTDEDKKAAQEFVKHAEKFPGRLLELPYIVESDILEAREEGKFRAHNIKDLPQGTKLNYVLDIASASFDEGRVREVFMNARMVFVNAVMGYAPHFSEGTVAMDRLIDANKEAVKMYGGGDTLQELKTLLPGLYIAALDHPKYCIFTGGGAVLKAIQEGSPYGMEPVRALIGN